VLSTDKYLRVVRAASRQSFRVVLLYVGLPSVEFSIARVALRVSRGGHGIPEAKLRERWPRTLDNFVRFLALADDVVLLSNAAAEPVVVGMKSAGGPLQLLLPEELPEVTARLERMRGRGSD
jgi:predicted ABC-type ATPase